jgi:hypothetical protein
VHIPPFYSVSAKQIGVLRGTCYKTARKELRVIRDALNLAELAPLTMSHLARYWDVPLGEITGVLFPHTVR